VQDKYSDTLIPDTLDFTAAPLKNTPYFTNKGVPGFTRSFKDPSAEEFACFVISNNNFQNNVIQLITTKISDGTFTGDFDIRLVTKNATDRDTDFSNDQDDSEDKKKFVSFEIYLKGFKLNGTIISPVEYPTTIKLYGRANDRNSQRLNIYTDKDAVLNLNGNLEEYRCKVYFKLSDIDKISAATKSK